MSNPVFTNIASEIYITYYILLIPSNNNPRIITNIEITTPATNKWCVVWSVPSCLVSLYVAGSSTAAAG